MIPKIPAGYPSLVIGVVKPRPCHRMVKEYMNMILLKGFHRSMAQYGSQFYRRVVEAVAFSKLKTNPAMAGQAQFIVKSFAYYL